MSEYEFTVSLRIRHPSIAPSRITETLGIEPQHTWKAGEARHAECYRGLAETNSTTRASRYFPVPSSRSNRRRSTGLTRCSSKPASRARRISSG